MPFKNLMRTHSPWRLVDPRTWKASDEAPALDAEGYLTSIPSHLWASSYLCLGALGHYQPGEYVCLYDGAGTLDFDFDAANVRRIHEGRYTFSVPRPKLGIRVLIKTTVPEDYVKNIRVMPAEFEGNEEPVWHPAFLENLRPFSVLRFMDWMRVSVPLVVAQDETRVSSPHTITLPLSASPVDEYYTGMMILSETGWQRRMIRSYDGATRTATVNAPWTPLPLAGDRYSIHRYAPREWSERTTGSYLRQNAETGVAVELMVDLCNTLGASPWFCIPSAASDDYVVQFATYVREHLNPGLKAYIEYSNETWNSDYPGYHYCVAKGAELGIDPWAYHAYRATQIHKLWSDVFGEAHLRADRTNSRLVRILASQAVYYAVGTTIMDYDGSGLIAGASNPFAPGKSAKDYADALAVGFYFTGDEAISNGSAFGTLSVDQLLDRCQASVDERTARILVNSNNARARGLDLLAYEGGQSLAVDTKTRYLRGTLRSAAADTAVLASNASAEDGAYNGRIITIEHGPGAGESRTIVAYVGATRTATLDAQWITPPTSTSEYLIRTIGHFQQDEMNRHPKMKDLYLRMLNNWRSIGVDANGKGCKVFCHFLDTAAWSQYGRWGSREYYDQPSAEQPKVQALEEFISQNPTWW